MLDIDGVLADLSAYEAILADSEVLAAQRWRAFFANIPNAAVLDAGHDLAWALDGLGYTVVYSTTRPSYARDATRQWLADHAFPEGRALLVRPATESIEHTRQAWQIKLAHTRAVTNRHPAWLRAFVDDDQDSVHRLAEHDVPAHESNNLARLGVAELRTRLDAALGSQSLRGGETVLTAAPHT